MSGQDDDSDKSFEPTPHKLQEARRKGDVPKSTDINATAAYAGLFVALVIVASGALFDSASAMMVFLDQSAQLAPLFFEGRATAPMAQAVQSTTGFLGILFGVPAIAVLTSVIAQRSVTFAPTKIAPKLNRISPLSVAKQKFGTAGLFEFFKSFLKLVIFSVCLALFIKSELPQMMVTTGIESQLSIAYLGKLILNFLAIVICVSAVIGGVDFTFQYFEHRRKLMMTRKEVQDETKESEGDPHMKQQRQQRGRERAMSHTLKDVETADVVIVNPTHYAVALHWSRLPGEAPTCVAKGTDDFALAIRERAMEHSVPIHEDPPTARALHATVEIGKEIPPELFQAVATAVRFAEAMRQRVRQRGY